VPCSGRWRASYDYGRTDKIIINDSAAWSVLDSIDLSTLSTLSTYRLYRLIDFIDFIDLSTLSTYRLYRLIDSLIDSIAFIDSTAVSTSTGPDQLLKIQNTVNIPGDLLVAAGF
jgi:hypothetical protein